MIYVVGEPPQWLLSVARELGQELVISEDCRIPPRSIVVYITHGCRVGGTIVLSLRPYANSIVITRNTARGVLEALINLMGKVGGADSLGGALRNLGFVETRVEDVMGVSEVKLEVKVEPGVVYTVLAIDDQGGRVSLGRGSARGTLIMDASATWLFGGAYEVYVARGDYLLELYALFMLFSTPLILPNAPY